MVSAPARVRRIAVSALEASSAALPAPRHAQQPATPAGQPRRRARLQLTPRTPAETAARFERLVRDTAARRSSSVRRPRAQSQQSAGLGEEKERVAPPLQVPGNTSEDEELLQIQKRLVFKARTTTATKRSQSSESEDEPDEEEEGDSDDSPPPPPPKTRSDQRERLSASFSVLEDVDALPKAKRKKKTSLVKAASGKRKSASPKASKALVLCEWTLQWPPVFERASDDEGEGDGSGKLQLVLEGQVLGHDAAFRVARRVSETQFVAATGESVRLDGCIDVEKSDARGIPEAVMELMLEGVPSHWRLKLKSLLPKRKTANLAAKARTPPTESVKATTTRKRTPARRYARCRRALENSGLTSHSMLLVDTSGIVQTASVSDESEPEHEDAVKNMKRSRSGRVITPVMDWWRGERLKTDVNGVTVVDPGSPAFLAYATRSCDDDENLATN